MSGRVGQRTPKLVLVRKTSFDRLGCVEIGWAWSVAGD